MPCVLCYETSSPLQKVRRCGFHVLKYGARVHEYIVRIFRNGWMDCRDAFHAALCLRTLLCNGQNIAEYEAYWLMGFPIINLWGLHFMSVFFVFSVIAGWIAEILFMLVTNATKLSTKQTGLSVF